MAGSETTGHTIAWTLYFLSKNPAAMAKLEAELDAAGLLVTEQRPQPREFAYADISKLRYLDCVIKVRPFCQSILHLQRSLPGICDTPHFLYTPFVYHPGNDMECC